MKRIFALILSFALLLSCLVLPAGAVLLAELLAAKGYMD